MDGSRQDATTPTIFVVFAIVGGLLFLLGGVLTAMSPNDRGVLIVGTIAFLLLGVYTLIVVIRNNRLAEQQERLREDLAAATDRDRGLRGRLAVTIREPIATIVSFADRLVDDPSLPGDERRTMLVELRASAREIDGVLSDLSESDRTTPEPRVMAVVRLDEELASVASSTISGVAFESWLDPARAWGDTATVRQVLRAVIGGIRSGGCEAIVLKTEERGQVATATVSGRCELMSDTGISALTGDGPLDIDDDWHRALRGARVAVASMGGSIAHTQALGTSHLVIELPAAPSDIAARPPRARDRAVLPRSSVTGTGTGTGARAIRAVDLRPERPTASLRFD